MKLLVTLCAALATAAPLVGAVIEGPEPTLPTQLRDILFRSPDHTNLLSAFGNAPVIEGLNLFQLLFAPGPYTLFAPTNDAFAEIGMDKYLSHEYRYHLAGLVLNHLVDGIVLSSSLELDAQIESFVGEMLNVTSLDPAMINDATILAADMTACKCCCRVVNETVLEIW